MAIRNRARRRYAIIAGFVVLLAGLFAVALIQAQLVANQHRLDRLRVEIADSEVEHARLERLVEEASAPSAIINAAMNDLGMVRAITPVYLAPSEPAVAVPVPISLGSVGVPTQLVAGPGSLDGGSVAADVEADVGVEAALVAAATAQDRLPETATDASVPTSLAGTTVVTDSGSVATSVATVVSDPISETVASEDSGGSSPEWAGAVAGTSGIADE